MSIMSNYIIHYFDQLHTIDKHKITKLHNLIIKIFHFSSLLILLELSNKIQYPLKKIMERILK